MIQGIQLFHDVQQKVLVGFLFWLLKCLKQFADFKDRARRKEYWMFTLFNLILFVLVNIVTVFGNITDVGTIFYLIMLISGLAVAVRKVHDVGKSGSYPFYSLILVIAEEEKCENKYGPYLKAIEVNLGI